MVKDMSQHALPISMDCQSAKAQLRRHFSALRRKVSAAQREKARRELCALLCEKIQGAEGRILSFASMGSEIQTDCLNQLIGDRLLLPPLDPVDPVLLAEPITLILVPGLCFDGHGYRLGYGRGYYDRLLSGLRGIPAFGIGFEQQFSPLPLPIEPHDVPLDGTFLL
jgi:5-formyltetrahydrofolate cyclo-ligase